jgi:catechol 2,3-dioxygenase-like lactoylglutathione lyase family enzyme
VQLRPNSIEPCNQQLANRAVSIRRVECWNRRTVKLCRRIRRGPSSGKPSLDARQPCAAVVICYKLTLSNCAYIFAFSNYTNEDSHEPAIAGRRETPLAGAVHDGSQKDRIVETLRDLAHLHESEQSIVTFTVDALDHLVLTVSDIEVAATWYKGVLGMVRKDSIPEQGKPSRTSVTFGSQKINLRAVSASKEEWVTAEHESVGAGDLCLLTTSTPEAVVQHLGDCGVAVVKGPIQRAGACGTLISVYCRDPDGSRIEIASPGRLS